MRIGLKVLSNKSLQGSILGVIQTIGAHLREKANDPEAIRSLGSLLQEKAPILVGAIMANTDAATKPDRVPVVENAVRELSEVREIGRAHV